MSPVTANKPAAGEVSPIAQGRIRKNEKPVKKVKVLLPVDAEPASPQPPASIKTEPASPPPSPRALPSSDKALDLTIDLTQDENDSGKEGPVWLPAVKRYLAGMKPVPLSDLQHHVAQASSPPPSEPLPPPQRPQKSQKEKQEREVITAAAAVKQLVPQAGEAGGADFLLPEMTANETKQFFAGHDEAAAATAADTLLAFTHTDPWLPTNSPRSPPPTQMTAQNAAQLSFNSQELQQPLNHLYQQQQHQHQPLGGAGFWSPYNFDPTEAAPPTEFQQQVAAWRLDQQQPQQLLQQQQPHLQGVPAQPPQQQGEEEEAATEERQRGEREKSEAGDYNNALWFYRDRFEKLKALEAQMTAQFSTLAQLQKYVGQLEKRFDFKKLR